MRKEEPQALTFLPPFRDGIFQVDPPRLLGSQCPACMAKTFPARDFCPDCTTEQAPLPAVLANEGSILTYTVVHQAPGNWSTPYALAYVDLDDGVRVLAQIDHPHERLHIGLRVRLILRNIVPEPGEPRLGFAFTESTTEKECA